MDAQLTVNREGAISNHRHVSTADNRRRPDIETEWGIVREVIDFNPCDFRLRHIYFRQSTDRRWRCTNKIKSINSNSATSSIFLVVS